MPSFAQGLRDMLWSFGHVLSTPRLWGYIVAPALVAGLIASVVLYFLYGPLISYADQVLVALPSWLSFIGSILKLIAIVAMSGASYVVFLAGTALCTAPFCEQLSESVELSLGGQPPAAFSFAGLMGDLIMGITHSLKRIVSYLAIMTALFAAALIIPVVGGIVFALGGAWVTIRFTAYDALDAVWARKSLGYQEKMKQLSSVRSRAYGIGALTALLMLVPVLNFFALPIAAVAATRLYVDELA